MTLSGMLTGAQLLLIPEKPAARPSSTYPAVNVPKIAQKTSRFPERRPAKRLLANSRTGINPTKTVCFVQIAAPASKPAKTASRKPHEILAGAMKTVEASTQNNAGSSSITSELSVCVIGKEKKIKTEPAAT